jgi:hypothetical protein
MIFAVTLQAFLFSSLSFSARSCSWVNLQHTFNRCASNVSLDSHRRQEQALYNFFAAYIQTIPLEELIESVERARLDAKLRYV